MLITESPQPPSAKPFFTPPFPRSQPPAPAPLPLGVQGHVLGEGAGREGPPPRLRVCPVV